MGGGGTYDLAGSDRHKGTQNVETKGGGSVKQGSERVQSGIPSEGHGERMESTTKKEGGIEFQSRCWWGSRKQQRGPIHAPLICSNRNPLYQGTERTE